MSIESPTNHNPTSDKITLTREDGSEWWVATDEETGMVTQGKSRQAALENLDEVVALYNGDIGHPPTDAELRELGIDPEDNTSGELPNVLK
jgi:predicted RNase H-like HicB family nuclease